MTLEHNIPMTTEQMTNIKYHIKTITGLPKKDETSETIVRNQQYLFEINNICSKSTISDSKYVRFPATLNLFLSLQNH